MTSRGRGNKKSLLSKAKEIFYMERVMGVEPTCQPWEGRILPMNYTRIVREIISYQNGKFKGFLTQARNKICCLREIPVVK